MLSTCKLEPPLIAYVPGCTACAQAVTDDFTTRLAVPPATLNKPLSPASCALLDAGLILKSARFDAGIFLEPDAGDKHRTLPSGSPGAVSTDAISSSAASVGEVRAGESSLASRTRRRRSPRACSL